MLAHIFGALMLGLIGTSQTAPHPLKPAPAVSILGPSWTQAPKSAADPYAYINQVHKETDGDISRLVVAHRDCNCDPADAVAMLKQALMPHGALIISAKSNFCNFPGYHLVATNIAKPENHMFNMDLYIFREDHWLYSIVYYFRDRTPHPAIRRLMPKLCPIA